MYTHHYTVEQIARHHRYQLLREAEQQRTTAGVRPTARRARFVGATAGAWRTSVRSTAT